MAEHESSSTYRSEAVAAGYECRYRTKERRTVAQLTVGVAAPAVGRATVRKRACMHRAGIDAGKLQGRRHRHRRSLRRNRINAQLPTRVVAPAIGGTVAGQCAGVSAAASKLSKRETSTDRD